MKNGVYGFEKIKFNDGEHLYKYLFSFCVFLLETWAKRGEPEILKSKIHVKKKKKENIHVHSQGSRSKWK